MKMRRLGLCCFLLALMIALPFAVFARDIAPVVSGDWRGEDAPAPGLVNMTRVAWTLIYAGGENVAILDGGFNKWKDDKKTLSKEMVKPKAGEYKGKANKAL